MKTLQAQYYFLFIIGLLIMMNGVFPIQGNEKINPNCKQKQEIIQQMLTENKFPGIQYINVGHNKNICTINNGTLDMATEKAVTSKSIFMANSTTKIITAIAIFQLAQRGQLQLHDYVSEYLPDQPHAEKYTIEQLLMHTSGLANPLPLKWFHKPNDSTFKENMFMNKVLRNNSNLDFEPGSNWQYSNLGYWLLGQIIAKCSNLSYTKYVELNIYKALRISKNEFTFQPETVMQLAKGHQSKFNIFNFILYLMLDSDYFNTASRGWSRFNTLAHNGLAYGGLFSTARAWQSILKDLTSKVPVLLSKKSRNKFLKFRVILKNKKVVSYGWQLGSNSVGNYIEKPGGGPGFFSNVRIYEEGDELRYSVIQVNSTKVRAEKIREFADRLDAMTIEI